MVDSLAIGDSIDRVSANAGQSRDLATRMPFAEQVANFIDEVGGKHGKDSGFRVQGIANCKMQIANWELWSLVIGHWSLVIQAFASSLPRRRPVPLAVQ
jgi:hypothetical protein